MIVKTSLPDCPFFGPFNRVDVLEDRLRCDGRLDLPLVVIGDYQILDDDSLMPPAPVAIPTAWEIISAADAIARAMRDHVVANVSPAEMASWPIKRAEALACQSSGRAADAPNLAIEAEARGITLADLVSKVVLKASRLCTLEARIAGHCGAIQDAARAATDPAELAAIDVNAGWPV